MNIILELNNNCGYEWHCMNNIYTKGYFLDDSHDDVCMRIAKCATEDDIVNLVKQLKGHFAIVIISPQVIMAFVDCVRSIPLFYQVNNRKYVLCDQLNVSTIEKHEVDENVREIFEKSLYTVGDTTLLRGVRQIPAGHYLTIRKGDECSIESYWKFQYKELRISDVDNATYELAKVYETVFKSIVSEIGNRTAIIPLSGGHDSRLVAYFLKKHGCKRIVAFSYGEHENTESALGKSVADALEIEFYFIPYGKEEVRLYKNVGEAFRLYAGNCTSVPCIQDFIAVHRLKEQGIINESDIVVPGYGGILTGHYVKESFLKSNSVRSEIVVQLIQSQFFGRGHFDKHDLSEKIQKNIFEITQLVPGEELASDKAIEVFEAYTILEEQSKFIANAVRGYEWCGLKWMMPLFDQRVFDIWEKIANELRFSDHAFKKMELRIYPQELLSIQFTGSKEIKHFHDGSEKECLIEKTKRRLRTYCAPRKTHYLNKFVGMKDYYENLLFHKADGVNDSVRKEYLRNVLSKLKG